MAGLCWAESLRQRQRLMSLPSQAGIGHKPRAQSSTASVRSHRATMTPPGSYSFLDYQILAFRIGWLFPKHVEMFTGGGILYWGKHDGSPSSASANTNFDPCSRVDHQPFAMEAMWKWADSSIQGKRTYISLVTTCVYISEKAARREQTFSSWPFIHHRPQWFLHPFF